MPNPKISIIVPVYKTEQYLRQCLDSLINQTMSEIEIICVNDGSPDNSIEILNEYSKTDSRIIVINKENGGLSSARNAGVTISTGKYLMFVDSDDWVDINICQDLHNRAEKNDADCAMCCYIKEYSDHQVESHIFENDIIYNENEVRIQLHRRFFGLVGEETAHPENADLIVSAWGQIFRKEICKNIEFVDTKKIGTEDALYQIMVYANCKKFVYLDKPYYHYRKENGMSLTSNYKPELFEKWQKLYDMMQQIIKDNRYEEEYETALNNRIAFSMIGLGLNEISAKNKSISSKSKRLKQILKTERYETAFSLLETKYMPFKWKVFFLLCKHRHTFLLIIMLECIDFLRKRIQ